MTSKILKIIILLLFVSFFIAPTFLGLKIRPSNIFIILLAFWQLSFFRSSQKIKVPFNSNYIFLITIFTFFTFINFDKFYFLKGVSACILLFICYLQYKITYKLIYSNIPFYVETAIVFMINIGFIYLSLVVIGLFLNAFGISNNLVAPNWQSALNEETEVNPSIIGYHTLTAGYLSSIGVLLVGRILFYNETNIMIGLFQLSIYIVALISSYSRGAWISFCIGSIILFFFYFRAKLFKFFFRKILLLLLLVIGIIVLIFYASTNIQDIISVQMLNLISTDQGTGYYRMSMWEQMLGDIIDFPIWGRGGGAFLKFISYEGSPSENYFLEIFQSSGLFGLLAVILPIIIVIGKSLKLIFMHKKSFEPLLIMIFAANIGLLFPILTTPGAWGGFYWFMFALWVSIVTHFESKLSKKNTK